MNVATRVYAVSGIALEDALWNIPAALAHQLQLIFLQRKRRTGSIQYHVVRTGESIYDISQVEGVRMEDMLEMNQLAPGLEPAAGEHIYLQGSAPSKPRLADNQR